MTKATSRRSFIGTSALGGIGMMAAQRAQSTMASWEPLPLDAPLELAEVATPALLLDLEALESNLDKMARHAEARGVRLRPHTKTHKCPILARLQLERGAVGVCAAKVSEAEVLVEAGIQDVLITSPIVTAEKISRLVALAQRSHGVEIVVDNAVAAQSLSDAAEAAGTTVGVLIDLDPGIRRTGIEPGRPALDLVEKLQKMPGLRFRGLQAYAGHVMHVKGWDERRARSAAALEACLETKRIFEKAGHEVAIFSGGGTGTFDIDSEVKEFTDLQVGSYLFMDAEYREIGDRDSDVFDAFAPSLVVLATAISQPVPELITVDAGFKSMATDTVKPVLRDFGDVEYHWGGDEHGILQFHGDQRPIALGDKVQILVPHCDPTVNLYDVYHPHRDGVVAELWPVAARGKSQ